MNTEVKRKITLTDVVSTFYETKNLDSTKLSKILKACLQLMTNKIDCNNKDAQNKVYNILITVERTKKYISNLEKTFKALNYLEKINFLEKGGRCFPFLEMTLLMNLGRDAGYDIFYEVGYCFKRNEHFCFGSVEKDGKMLHKRTTYLSEYKMVIDENKSLFSPWKKFPIQMMTKRLIGFLLRDSIECCGGFYESSEKADFEKSDKKNKPTPNVKVITTEQGCLNNLTETIGKENTISILEDKIGIV